MKLILKDPDKYKGFSTHPGYDNTLRQVKNAFIEPIQSSVTGWVRIKIDDGEIFMSSSPSVRGAKQQFAFQCQKGSKWIEEKRRA